MIGIAGCGRMGAPMLRGLRSMGLAATGFDVRPPAEFGDMRMIVTDDAEGFARTIDTLITVVRDIPQTEEVLFGAQNFAFAPQLERIIVSSTLSPTYVAGLRARVPDHVALLDAPMSGARIAAEEQRLTFMVGGRDDDIEEAMPLFLAMGRRVHRMGPYGAGMQAKVLNNLLAASNTAMTRLVLDWAGQRGIERERLLSLIDSASGQNWFASGFDKIEFAHDGFADDNTIGILVKDIDSALDAAPEGADLTLPETVRRMLAKLPPMD